MLPLKKVMSRCNIFCFFALYIPFYGIYNYISLFPVSFVIIIIIIIIIVITTIIIIIIIIMIIIIIIIIDHL